MNDQDKNQAVEVGENDELDLGSEPAKGFDPFGDTSFADEELPDEEPKADITPAPKPETKKDTDKQEQDSSNPLEKAMDTAETKEAAEAQKSLFTKLPVLEYGGVSEDVEDTSKTFEDLRIEKSTDFPELEESKNVSWTVEYGKITKNVSNPKAVTIAKMKSDIETSKEFLEALKKSKDKDPICKLKPKVTAQKKGKMPAYKGVFTSMEDAASSDKVISIFPARDGKVYEMRRNEMGRFITPISRGDMLSEVEAGFIPALPPLPFEKLLCIIGFFRSVALNGSYEALVNIYWDKDASDYIVDVPNQTVTPTSVESEKSDEFDNFRYIHYMDIHSHNTMNAFFSQTDDRDEKATRVYAVIGNVFNYIPDIKVRISNGGTFCEIDPGVVFENIHDFSVHPASWLGRINKKGKWRLPKTMPPEKMVDFLTKLHGGDDE